MGGAGRDLDAGPGAGLELAAAVPHAQPAPDDRERLAGGGMDVLAGHRPAGAQVQGDDQQPPVGRRGGDTHDPALPGDRVVVQRAHPDRQGARRLRVPIGPGEVESVGQDGDGPNAVQAQAAGPVEVEGRVAPEAQPLVYGDRGGHELGGVQAQHGRAGLPRPLQAGLDQPLTDPGPRADRSTPSARSPAQPAGHPNPSRPASA